MCRDQQDGPQGRSDAVRDVRKQVQRNREAFGTSPEDMPVYGCMASKFATPASPRCIKAC